MDSGKHLSRKIFLATFIAGFVFLVFEINLFRALSNLLGATVSASTLVLSIFMGGYGFGSLYFGNKAKPNVNIIKLFGQLLFSFGISGLIVYLAINNILPGFQNLLLQSINSSIIATTIIYTLVVVLLFIPSFFMGGVLPLATKIVARTHNEIAKSVGNIYALDTLGSALGGLLTGFLLNRFFGQFQTLSFAVILIIITATVIYRQRNILFDNVIDVAKNTNNKSKKENKNRVNQFVLLSTMIFGFSMSAMQIILIRVFKIYLINTVYSFALISSMVIIGYFIGSYWFKNYSKKHVPTVSALTVLLVLFGAITVLNLFIIQNIPSFIMFPLGDVFDNQLFRVLGIPFIASVVAVLPLSITSGFAFPLACAVFSDNIDKVGKQIGTVVMLNTVGAVLGPLVATFILIPVVGILKGLLALSGIIFLITLIYALRAEKVKVSKQVVVASLIGIALILGIGKFKTNTKVLPPSFIKSGRNIVAYKESIEGTYVVGEDIVENNRILTTYVNNSAVIGTSYDAIKAVKMVGHLPFLLGLDCKNALVVGFGIGVTTAAIGVHKDVENIDCIELVKSLTDVAHFYTDINNNIHNDSRLRFYEDDGRHFMQTTDKKYDLISSDPTHPILGSGSLYTYEYFKLCRSRLTENGLVSQYLPLHKLSLSDFLGLIKTFHSVFPNSTVWLGHYHAILIGSMKPINIDFNTWSNNMHRTSDDKLFLNNPYYLAANLVLDATAIEKITAAYKINTDNIAYTDYFSFNSLREDNIAKNLDFLNDNRDGVWRVFNNLTDTVQMQRFIKGNQYFTKGLVYMFYGDWKQLFQYIEKACMVNPENVEYPLMLEFYGRAEKFNAR